MPTFKVISWNVNGFASLAKKSVETLRSLVDKEKPDLLCLQETKLQTENAGQYETILPGYK
jgi:exonuclease III